MSPNVDALVIGAGPTGLTIASELIKRNLRVRIVDQNERPTNQSRALGLQSRTLEIFEKMGVIDAMLDKGLPIDRLQIYDNGKPIGGPSLSALAAPYPFILILPQADTEQILNAHLESLGGKVERPCQVIHVEESKAIFNHPDGKQEMIEPRWIIGCDGAHSIVRTCLNIPFKGSGFAEGFCLADVVLETNLNPKEIHSFISPSGLFLIIPLPHKNQFRLVATFPKGFKDKALTIEFLQNILQERTHLSARIQSKIWTSIFFVQQRQVPNMRQGSIFLCGDAAHIHSPAGGQGLNISVQDAFNLAWKIALVHLNQAPDSLLDTYQEERHPVAKHVLEATTAGTYFLVMPHLKLRSAFFKLMSRLFRIPFFRKRFAYAVSELSTHYKKSSIVAQPLRDIFWRGPQPGTRAPILDNPEEVRHILLIFGAPGFNPKLPEKLVCLEHVELDSPIALAYKVKKPCLYLIRPDGYVAFRMNRIDPKPLDMFLLKIFL
jgi:2-polyprenyl-6-methoxyphenol hydroxylase-like FAD-dependent oxidoreductase